MVGIQTAGFLHVKNSNHFVQQAKRIQRPNAEFIWHDLNRS
jgi:hypothetical protein